MSTSSSILSRQPPLHQLDKISRLPDDILLNVLSRLHLKKAVQMSILAKRWRYLWTWLSNLDLDPGNLSPNNCFCEIPDETRTEEYMMWVSRVIDAHRGPCISKFRIFVLNMGISDPSQIEKFVRFAFSKRVEDLDLDLDLLQYTDTPRFSLGFDILKHPHNNGIFNLKSLRLSSIDISAEALQFILLQCHLLEWLYVKNAKTLCTLHILSYKLKHLSLMRCDLTELEIDAPNLIRFQFEDSNGNIPTNVVFKNVTKLIEVDLDGSVFFQPFSTLKQFSCLFKQLLKLSFSSTIDPPSRFRPVVMNVLFPNVKQLTLTVESFNSVFIKLFIDACPMLQELKLQVPGRPGYNLNSRLEEEAKQLREIELEVERSDMMSMDQNSYSEAQKKNVASYVEPGKYENNTIHPKLKVLEVVGFHGCDADIEGALNIILCANSLEVFIWDHQTPWVIQSYCQCDQYVEKTNTIRRRAGKLAKLLPPNVHVAVRDKSGLIRVS